MLQDGLRLPGVLLFLFFELGLSFSPRVDGSERVGARNFLPVLPTLSDLGIAVVCFGFARCLNSDSLK